MTRQAKLTRASGTEVNAMEEVSRDIKMAQFVEANGITTSLLRHREENGLARSPNEASVG